MKEKWTHGRQYSKCSLQLELGCFCPVYPIYSLYDQLFVKSFRNGNLYGKAFNPVVLTDEPDCKPLPWKKSQRLSRARKCGLLQMCLSLWAHSRILIVKTVQTPGPYLLFHFPELPYGFRGYICLQNQWFGGLCTVRGDLGRVGVRNHNSIVV